MYFNVHMLVSICFEPEKKLLFFFYLGFTARQDYFTHFEPSQSLGGAKTGGPREKHLTTHMSYM